MIKIIFILNLALFHFTITNAWSFNAVVDPVINKIIAPPANDLCVNATAINCGHVLNQTTIGATGGAETSCVWAGMGHDVWYKFTGSGAISQIGINANGANPRVEVFKSTDGTCSGFALDQCFAIEEGTSTNVIVAFQAALGTVYYFHVANYYGGHDFDFSLSLLCEGPTPANDECSGAYAVNVNPNGNCNSVVTGTLSGGTPSVVTEDENCGGNPSHDVWFSFVATSPSQVISFKSLNWGNFYGMDLYHSIYQGDCSGLTLVPGTCSYATYSTPSGFIVGNIYYIRVYASGNSLLQTYTFEVCVGTLPPPPPNDNCIDATPLVLGNDTTGITAGATTTPNIMTSCNSNPNNDVWYSTVVPPSGALKIKTTHASGSGPFLTNCVLSAYSGACGSLVQIGCMYDSIHWAELNLTGLASGETVLIAVSRSGYLNAGIDGDFIIKATNPFMATASFNTANFKFYPNPVNDVLNISYNKNITAVAVFNLLGKEVVAKTLNSNLSQIDMSHLAKGTYMVKVTADNEVKTIKVVKQ